MRRLGLALLCSLSAPPAFASPAPVVAVFDVVDMREGKSKLSKNDLAALTTYLAGKLAEGGSLRMVPPQDLKAALREKQKESYAACVDEKCQIEIGKEVAAQRSLSTKIVGLGSECALTATLYDVKEGASVAGSTVKGPCTVQAFSSAIDKAVGDLLGRTVKPAPRPPETIILDARAHHLGDQEGGPFQQSKPLGKSFSLALPPIPPQPDGCEWALAARVSNVVHLESPELDHGYVDELRIAGRTVARLNDYVAHEAASAHDVAIPLRGVALREGAPLEIVAGADTRSGNLDDFEVSNLRLVSSCDDPRVKGGDAPAIALDPGSHHLGDDEGSAFSPAKPSGPSWSAAAPAVPPLRAGCSWALSMTAADIVPSRSADHAKGDYVDEVKVDGRTVAHLNDFVDAEDQTRRKLVVPLRGVPVREGSILEIVVGKDKAKGNLDDVQISKLDLVPWCPK